MANVDGGRSSPSGNSTGSGKAKSRPRSVISETINFNEAGGETGFLIGENSTNIIVKPSRSTQVLPESKLKIRNLVDYNWESDYSTGRMLSTHMSGKYIAYVVRVTNAGGVRIVDIQTHDRVLIKGSKGHIRDVEFLHKMEDLTVGFIDEYGTSYIYRIAKDPKSKLMQTLLILEVSLPGAEKLNCRRFIWCKCVPDDSTAPVTAKDGSYLFAVIQNDKVFVANLCQLVETFGEGRHTWTDFKKKLIYMELGAHTDSVLDASFAPDGTAIATASQDGTVKFYQYDFALDQVYLAGSETTQTSRCLYSWAPHNGDPVTGIFFLDDHSPSAYDSEKQYWKYLLTGGPDMNELKLWTCKDWACLQTIKFSCPSPSQLKMDLNVSAKFLVVSDIHRKCMFVVSIVTDEEPARFEWISEFSLPCCMLSLNINNARTMTLRQIEAAGYDEYVVNEMEGASDDQYCILDISYVQPKSLQQGNIAFQLPKFACEPKASSTGRISFDASVSYIEGKAGELSDSPRSSSEDDEEFVTEPSQAAASRKSISPTSNHPSTSMLSQQLSSLLLNSSGSSFSNGVQKKNERATSLPPVGASLLGILTTPNMSTVAAQSVQEDTPPKMSHESPNRLRDSRKNSNSSQASSSPSREVEQILSPKTTEQQHTHKNDIIQNMDEILAVNNFDLEGNIVQDNFNFNPKRLEFSPNVACEAAPQIQMPQLLGRVSSIMEMMQAQAREMTELKREVSRLNNSHLSTSGHLDEPTMTRIMDRYFSQSALQVQRLEDNLKSVQLEKHRGAAAAPALPPNFTEIVTVNIAKLLKSQMESTVLPSILTLFEPVRTQVQAELVKMVMNAETRIKQELKQVIQSPDFRNSIAADLEINMKSTCENIIPRVLLTSIVPTFEKSLQSLFAKVNDTFLTGTKEYIGGVKGSLELRRSVESASQEDLKDQLNNMQDNLSSILQVELESQMQRVLNSLQATLIRQVEETVVRELNRSFKDQQRFLESTIVSRALTPALSVSDHAAVASSPVDPEALLRQMFKLVERGDIAGAFVQASHYSDISYMITLAEKINPNEVFTPKLPTQTHVAIIQHMASDLISHTELKLTYLGVAMSTLNTSDKKALRSVARIIPVFQTSIRKLVEASPRSPHLQTLRMMELAFKGMCSQAGESSSSSLNN